MLLILIKNVLLCIVYDTRKYSSTTLKLFYYSNCTCILFRALNYGNDLCSSKANAERATRTQRKKYTFEPPEGCSLLFVYLITFESVCSLL